MVIQFAIDGYNELIEKLAELAVYNYTTFIFFTCNVDDSGDAWCPLCVPAEITVKAEMRNLRVNDVYIRCNIGLKEYWENPECPFRTDEHFLLTCIPTLIMLGKPQRRLEIDSCCDPTVVGLLFEAISTHTDDEDYY